MCAHCTCLLLLLLAAHCFFQPSAFACHRARRCPTPRLPASCVRLLRARAAACSVLSASATAGRGAAGWLVLPLLLLLSNSACSPQQQLFLFCFQREDRLWQARGFFIRDRCLRTRNKNLVGTSPPASALSALAQPTRACARCVCACARHLLFHFHFDRRFSTTRARARTRTLSRGVCQRFLAPNATSPRVRLVRAASRARASPSRCLFFCASRVPLPLSCCAACPLCSAATATAAAAAGRCPTPPCARALPRPPLPAQSQAVRALPVVLVSAATRARARAAQREQLSACIFTPVSPRPRCFRAQLLPLVRAWLPDFPPCVRALPCARAAFARRIDSPPAPLAACAHLCLRCRVARRARAATPAYLLPAIPPARAGCS